MRKKIVISPAWQILKNTTTQWQNTVIFTIVENINTSNKIPNLTTIFSLQHCSGLFFTSFSVTEYLTCQTATFFSKAPISFSNLSYCIHFSLLLISTRFSYLHQLSTFCKSSSRLSKGNILVIPSVSSFVFLEGFGWLVLVFCLNQV